MLFASGPRIGPGGALLGGPAGAGRARPGPGSGASDAAQAHDWLLLGHRAQPGADLGRCYWWPAGCSPWACAGGSPDEAPRWRYNLTQTGLVLLTLARPGGPGRRRLPGTPRAPGRCRSWVTAPAGGLLNWYQDRGGPGLPQVSVISVPMWVYRALMLAWALWLALRLLDWLRWGWEGFSQPVLWRGAEAASASAIGVDGRSAD